MRHKLLPIFAGVLLIFSGSCKKEEPPKGPQYMVTSTVREIMGAMVMPSADALWNAVSSSVTDKGLVEKAPRTEQEWKDMRGRAITIMEAADLILIPGRHVAKPGEPSEDAKANLPPDEIEKLIAKDPESWTKFAHELHDSVMPAMKAIDAKNAMALSDAGGEIDKACENCHLKFWYPNQEKKN